MSQFGHLVDTSAFVRLMRVESLRDRWREQIGAGLLAVCPVTELEILHSARSKSDRDAIRAVLRESFTRVVMPDRVFERAAEVQDALVDRGTHRCAGTVDLLVAAAAELQGLTLLHYDEDFVQIAEVTGQPIRWLAAPGSIS